MNMQELDRQLSHLLRIGYPEIAGVAADEFAARVEPLRKRAATMEASAEGRVRFVIVVTRDLVPPEQAMTRVELRGKQGFVDIKGAQPLADFQPIEGVEVPESSVYLLMDVDTGKESLNVTPDAALEAIRRQGRSPLTIEEGVALVTHVPELLKTHNAFSLLGSRSGDRRVAAIWVSAGRPRLGWCWAGNPHTWLGSASCNGRVGAAARVASR
jgi:hypothetical protein